MAGRASAWTASGRCSLPFPARGDSRSPSELPSSSSAGPLPAPFPAGPVAVSEGLRGACPWCLCRGGPGRAAGWAGSCLRAAPRRPFHPQAPGERAVEKEGAGGDPDSPGSEGLVSAVLPRCPLCCRTPGPCSARGSAASEWKLSRVTDARWSATSISRKANERVLIQIAFPLVVWSMTAH